MNQVGLREHLKQGWFWIQVGVGGGVVLEEWDCCFALHFMWR